MPSPFPGMDPYLEDPVFWRGFHSTFTVYVRSVLTPLLPDGYYAEVEQHVWLEDDENERNPFAIPDAYVAERSGGGTAVLTRPGTRSFVEVLLPQPRKVKGNRFVNVVDRARNRVVTTIELLSPSNKQVGDDRDRYLEKRNQYLQTGLNLVEIDLLRDGDRLPMGRPRPPLADYYCVVSRADRFPHASVWTFTVRDPMPELPIPLKPEHGAVLLDLRTCLDRTYDDADYAKRIDYRHPPAVGLRPGDAEWAVTLLAKTTTPPARGKKK